MSPTTPQQPAPPSRANGKLVAGIGLAVAAAVLAITWQSGQRSASESVSEAAESAAISPAAARRPSGRPPATAGDQPAVDAPLTPEQLHQRLLDVESKGAAEADAAQRYWLDGFAAQSVNPAWARAKEVEVRKIVEAEDFDAYGIQPTNLRIECRTSLCKVTGTFASRGNAEDWMRAFTLKTAQSFSGGATHMEKQPSGEWNVRVLTAASK